MTRVAAVICALTLLALATTARADGSDGTWLATGPASCPFRMTMVVAGLTITMSAVANAGAATSKIALGADGTFSGKIDAPYFATVNGKFEQSAVHLTIQSSRCGTVSVTGARAS